MSKKVFGLGVVAGLVAISAAAQASDVSVSASSVSARSVGGVSNMMLTVSGPDGFYEQRFVKTGAPVISLYKNGALADGQYNWELTGAKSTTRPIRANSAKALDNGRGAKARAFVNDSYYASGSFRVINGAVYEPNPNVKE